VSGEYNALLVIALASVLIGASVLSLLLYDDPVADAGEDKVVDVGELVQFDASNSKGAILYYWNFRDNGWVNTSASPTRTYFTEGVYDVSLVVTGITGKQSIDTVRITVRNDPPVANAGDDVTAFEDDIVTFDASGTIDSSVDMPSLSYKWDFGDGCNASGMIVTHRYSKSGLYRALLSVTDDQGAIGRDTRSVLVLNRAPAVSIPDITIDEGNVAIVTAVGTDTPSDTPALRYEWDNGKFGSTTAYSFEDNGAYHPQVIVKDDDDAVRSGIGNVYVNNVPPVCGVISTYVKADVTLRIAGEKWHDLKLSIYRDYELQDNISIYRLPGDPDEQTVTLDNVTFDLSSQYLIEIEYTPDDDRINGQPQGANPAWVILRFEDGSDEKFFHSFNVEQPESYLWRFDPTSSFVNHKIYFEGFAFDQGRDDISLLWEFGDGTSAGKLHSTSELPAYFEESVSHEYASAGEYLLRLTAIDDDGSSYQFSTIVSIGAPRTYVSNLAPRASIIASLGTVYEDSPFSAIATAEDRDSLTYEWHFGDGRMAEENMTSPIGNTAYHTYGYSGTFTVYVAVRDEKNAVGIAVTNVTVINTAPTAIIRCDVLGMIIYQDMPVTLNASATRDTPTDFFYLTFRWEFDDGSVAYGEAIEHVFVSPGTHRVILSATDNDGEENITALMIDVLPVSPRAYLSNRIAYGAHPVLTFEAIGDDTLSDVFNLSYTWDFGDGCIASGGTVNHTYPGSGLYEITLKATDPSGLSASATASVIVAIDSDGDSITDDNEEKYGTSALSADSDSDSIVDYWEIFNYRTDPGRIDSDDDGAQDWYEIAYLGYYVDTDHDGLLNPWDPDSDEDGMLDGEDPDPLLYNSPTGATYPIISVAKNITEGFDVVACVRYNDGGWYEAPIIRLDDSPILPGEESIFPPLNITVPNARPHVLYVAIYYEEGANGSVPELYLALYTFDTSIGAWRIFDDTYVDDAENFVWGELKENGRTHTYNSAIRDSDNDGLTDLEETSPARRGGLYWWSDPNDPDTDDDGLSDFKERKITWTSPRVLDTDSDGLADGWIEKKDKLGRTNGFWDYGEIQGELGDEYGMGGWGTNPKNYDSDGDGLWDGWKDMNSNGKWDVWELPGEVGDAAQRFRGGYRTNPCVLDTDNDGVNDSADADPLTDLWLYVDIKIVHALDSMDSGSAADFAWTIMVKSPDARYLEEQGHESAYEIDNDLIYPGLPITYSFDVRDDISLYYVILTLYDIDDNRWNYCDISRSAIAATIQYDLKRGEWVGDDSHQDTTGYGLVRGDEDGSTAKGCADTDPAQNDCELFFGIRTTAFWVDRDYLTTWEEVNIYRSDPLHDDSEDDWDGDGIPNDYEALHGLDLQVNDAMQDLDGDLVPNLWEYQLRDRGKSPDNPYDTYGFDLVVSINWDANSTYINWLMEGMQRASSLLFDTTDGYFLIKSVAIYDNSVQWDSADILIHQGDTQRPETTYFIEEFPFIGHRHINMPEKFKRYVDQDPFRPDQYQYYQALVHEIGHYELQLWEEYRGPMRLALLGIPEDYRVPSIMASGPIGFKELSTFFDYNVVRDKILNDIAPLEYIFTDQIVLGGGPCWQKVFVEWNYFNGNLVIKGEIPRGVQFDLDRNGIVDRDYYIDYHYDEFDDYSTYWKNYYRVTYPVGNFMIYNIY